MKELYNPRKRFPFAGVLPFLRPFFSRCYVYLK